MRTALRIGTFFALIALCVFSCASTIVNTSYKRQVEALESRVSVMERNKILLGKAALNAEKTCEVAQEWAEVCAVNVAGMKVALQITGKEP